MDIYVSSWRPSQSARLAGGDEARCGCLRGNHVVSKKRVVWFDSASQARCCIDSIEYRGRRSKEFSTREYVQFLGIATGSLSELETQLELGMMLKYVPDNADILRHTHRVGRLLTVLRTSLKEKANREEGRR